MEMTIEQGAKLRIEKRPPTQKEYQSLRSQYNWYTLENQFTKAAFGKEVYSVVVLDGPNVIGMGRVVGDGAIYFTIQDIIVHPNYNNKSVSRLIMGQIEAYFETIASRHAYIGLVATSETREFYEKYGFTERKTKNYEMFKILMR
ncbi:GNAT family N-acetyltransferase [Allomuricauda sp. SCSIO 65647]|uniref:GNAT family N-acetyltransferase n=1 Tax=Allomuricauda sp. SCSIO 65647 TaxID=2908843 RepID=UPI001F3E5646|nr:GNAT family N-acetyltransferase [Muricauda sp. SCSIO 65647]UJH66728.1 GNAT family N-acetyltransferase [Muricauda sp. SCSIO 65647]